MPQRALTVMVARVLLWCALCARPTGAQEASLGSRVGSFLSTGPVSAATVGVCVVDVTTGEILYARNERALLIPASTMKLVTAAGAMEALGLHYEFRTVVYARGRLDGGTLLGDLVLKGGGDPTIGGRHEEEDALTAFRRWGHVLRSKGIERVTGDVVADDSAFDRVWRHPDWGDYPAWNWYYTTTSAVAINDNCVTVTVKPGPGPGNPAVVSVHPACAPVKVANLCKTDAKEHSIWFDRSADSDVIRVGGRVRANSQGFPQMVPVPDPPLYAACALKEALEQEGIPVGGQARAAGADEVTPGWPEDPLLERRTVLEPVLRTMLKESHNHYAEQVVKAIGAEATGLGSWSSGLTRTGGVLREMGFADDEFRLADGSGLSRENRVTAHLLAALLAHVRRSADGDLLASMLAVAGEDGTLKKRLAEPPYAGNVRAKTGYLNGVGALGGYATTRGGRQVAFAVLVNDSRNPPGAYSMARTVDEVCRAIVDLTP